MEKFKEIFNASFRWIVAIAMLEVMGMGMLYIFARTPHTIYHLIGWSVWLLVLLITRLIIKEK